MPASATRLRDRWNWRDTLLASGGGLFTAGFVLTLVTQPSAKTALAAVFGFALFASLPIARSVFLARGAVVAELDRDGIRLYDDTPNVAMHKRNRTPLAEVRWADARRIVLWRRTHTARGLTYRVTRLGIETNTDPELHGADLDALLLEPGFGAILSKAFDNDPRDGVPAHVSEALVRRSVAFSASGARALAAAVAQFAPKVPVVDARNAGRPRRVEAVDKGPRR